jgi:hypothetical protein
MKDSESAIGCASVGGGGSAVGITAGSGAGNGSVGTGCAGANFERNQSRNGIFTMTPDLVHDHDETRVLPAYVSECDG